MASAMNSYSALPNNVMEDEILRSEAGFTFVDFLPKEEPSSFFSSKTYENFRVLVDRANYFLRFNKQWKIVTCESIELKKKNGKINPLKMTYREYGEAYNSYIRGLRVWLTERKDANERVQQIAYLTLVPQQLEKGKIFRAAKYETLDEVLQRFNSRLCYDPLPGRIITIESQEMKMSSFQKFDPDYSSWHDRGPPTTYLFVIRIFCDSMAAGPEEIGIKDFIPTTIHEGGIFSLPEYEQFSNVVKQASTWLSQQQFIDFRFCNAQTLQIKVKRGNDVNTQKMLYAENRNVTYYVRILRISYTKPFSNPYSVIEKSSPVTELTCRTFIPIRLSARQYENLVVTRERISAWVKATGAEVLSAETTPYRIRSGGERKQGSEASFTYDKQKDLYWMFVIRLYIKGVYQEPPPEMLPPLPPVYEDICYVS